FQAEDGIRDIGVTGVQTCALPISGYGRRFRTACIARQRGVVAACWTSAGATRLAPCSSATKPRRTTLYLMPFPVTAYRIFIASPGGLDDERHVFRRIINDYNETDALDDGALFVPVGWEL